MDSGSELCGIVVPRRSVPTRPGDVVLLPGDEIPLVLSVAEITERIPVRGPFRAASGRGEFQGDLQGTFHIGFRPRTGPTDDRTDRRWCEFLTLDTGHLGPITALLRGECFCVLFVVRPLYRDADGGGG